MTAAIVGLDSGAACAGCLLGGATPASSVGDQTYRRARCQLPVRNLGVRITDAALAGETTVVFADLIVDGPGRCPG